MKRIEKTFTENGIRKIIVVEYGIRETNHKYFSVTGSIGYKSRGRYRDSITDLSGGKWECEMSGCIHNEIIKRFPKMQDIVSLHLSDSNGIPMYHIENGFYHWSKKDIAKEYLRLNDEQYRELDKEYLMKGKQAWGDLLEKIMLPIWKQQASDVINKYNL